MQGPAFYSCVHKVPPKLCYQQNPQTYDLLSTLKKISSQKACSGRLSQAEEQTETQRHIPDDRNP